MSIFLCARFFRDKAIIVKQNILSFVVPTSDTLYSDFALFLSSIQRNESCWLITAYPYSLCFDYNLCVLNSRDHHSSLCVQEMCLSGCKYVPSYFLFSLKLPRYAYPFVQSNWNKCFSFLSFTIRSVSDPMELQGVTDYYSLLRLLHLQWCTAI